MGRARDLGSHARGRAAAWLRAGVTLLDFLIILFSLFLSFSPHLPPKPLILVSLYPFFRVPEYLY